MTETKSSLGRWHRLDNTANMFPVISNKSGPNVYRLALTLNKTVAPELLQQALEKVLPWFSAFRVRLRRGFFWYYLEENPGMPQVREEEDFPCRSINPKLNDGFLFRLAYYAKRVNLEVYHVLADGTGAMQFLLAICCQYLMLAYPADFTPEQKALRWCAENARNTEDGYVEHYTPAPKTTFNLGQAFRLRGERSLLGNLSVVHVYLATDELLALCRGKGVSIAQYLAACLAWAVYTQQLRGRPPKHPVRILLPVNLRSYFESSTTLNFFSNVYITLDFSQKELTFEEVLGQVKTQFGREIQKDKILQRISYTVGSGYSPWVRALPLPIKNIGLRLLYEQGSKSSTLSFSNMGAADIPAPFKPYVAGALALLSPNRREAFRATAFSLGNLLTLSFASTLRDMGMQRAVARRLAGDGLAVSVETNGVDHESL
jgi:NRPS condensation-like uncharacterized protein